MACCCSSCCGSRRAWACARRWLYGWGSPWRGGWGWGRGRGWGRGWGAGYFPHYPYYGFGGYRISLGHHFFARRAWNGGYVRPFWAWTW